MRQKYPMYMKYAHNQDLNVFARLFALMLGVQLVSRFAANLSRLQDFVTIVNICLSPFTYLSARAYRDDQLSLRDFFKENAYSALTHLNLW